MKDMDKFKVKYRLAIILSVMIFILFVNFIGGFDVVKYKKFKFTDGTPVLVNRFTDKVEYVWIQSIWVVPSSMRMDDSEFTPQELMQHRYDAEKKRPRIRPW
jgi:hypothetical protein